jgi:hypothetical protein
MTQRIGNDLVSDKTYAKLRARYRAARTSTPWEQWAVHYLSDAGRRERALARQREEYEERNALAVAAQITALNRAETAEQRRRDRVAELRAKANERDEETNNYTPAALRAQRQLAEMGVPRRRGESGVLPD